MAIGDILKFGTMFVKNKASNQTIQLSSTGAGDDISTYVLGDTYCDKFSRSWVEIEVNEKTVYIGTDFAAINNDCDYLLNLHDQIDYIDKKDYRTVILTEQEWRSIPEEYIELINWDAYPDMYAMTYTLEDDKVVWLRYEGEGNWIRRVWGTPGEYGDNIYMNGFIPVLYESSTAWGESDTTSVYDLGPQHRPFGVRYTVKDKDQQDLFVSIKLDDDVIEEIDFFDKNKYGVVKIDKDIFDSLELVVQHTITIEATDFIHTDVQYLTFRKMNNSPVVKMSVTDIGTVGEKPEIWYEVSDFDGDALTIIEKINGVQIRSYSVSSATSQYKAIFNIPNDFWANCKPGVNRVEVYAIDTFGAVHKGETTFEKESTTVTYTVFYAVEGDIRYERIFEAEDGTEELRGYTYSYDTRNRYMDFSLAGIDEGTEIKVWMVTHNPYASAKYKTSNVLTFNKAFYGKPIIGLPVSGSYLTQNHSEYGKLCITYEHEDVHYVDGVLTSRDPDRQLSDYEGELQINYYVDGMYGGIYPIENNTIQIGETREETIDFSIISPDSRSHEITYFVTIRDKKSGTCNSDKKPTEISLVDLISGSHYYNDEPTDPIVHIEYKDEHFKDYVFTDETDDPKVCYGFDYIDIYWDSLIDRDGDHSVYHMYLNTPRTLNEEIFSTSIPSREGPNVIDYTRIYEIEEKRDSSGNVVGSVVYRLEDGKHKKVQENNFLGVRINYEGDSLDRIWPEKEEYSFAIMAHDERSWDNSYYGLYKSTDDGAMARRSHTYPDEVKLTVLPNLVDGLGDGEKGRITMLYNHSEITDRPGIVDLYAYQDGELMTKVYSGEFYPGKEQTITIDFTMYEYNTKIETDRTLKRSKNITYYATATDIFGFNSLSKFAGMSLDTIPYIEPDSDGTYGYYIVSANNKTFNFNNPSTFNYEGPVQIGHHYFNEEPPATTPEEYDPTKIGHEIIEIKWPHVVDPDGDEVKYEIYVANSIKTFNIEEKVFYSDNQPDDQDYVVDGNNDRAIVSTLLKYHKVIEVPASVAAEYSKRFEISVAEYLEDSDINVWIVSKDPYVNSYYRSGEIISLAKGHVAKEIRSAYPRNNAVVYAKTPRILIYLGKDNLDQTVFVQWLDEVYNNMDNPEYFSNEPNKTNVVVFKPPVPYTGVSGNKVTYSVWVHNRCTYSEKTYVTYTYKNFFDDLSDDKVIPIKSNHVNLLRQAINVTRDAYGLDQYKYTREVRKDMLFENFDFNDTKRAIMEINDKINNAAPGEGLDYINPLIVDVKDLDLVEYEGTIAAGSYEEFLEWARLLYILENL